MSDDSRQNDFAGIRERSLEHRITVLAGQQHRGTSCDRRSHKNGSDLGVDPDTRLPTGAISAFFTDRHETDSLAPSRTTLQTTDPCRRFAQFSHFFLQISRPNRGKRSKFSNCQRLRSDSHRGIIFSPCVASITAGVHTGRGMLRRWTVAPNCNSGCEDSIPRCREDVARRLLNATRDPAGEGLRAYRLKSTDRPGSCDHTVRTFTSRGGTGRE